MGLLGAVTSMLGGGDPSHPVSAIVQMLANHEGGLAGLVSQFQQGGLGDIMSSWLGQGQNQAISAGQLQNIFHPDQLAGLAQKLGVDPQQAASQLSGLLPQIIDKLSPQGSLPQGSDWVSQATGMLSSLMK